MMTFDEPWCQVVEEDRRAAHMFRFESCDAALKGRSSTTIRYFSETSLSTNSE